MNIRGFDLTSCSAENWNMQIQSFRSYERFQFQNNTMTARLSLYCSETERGDNHIREIDLASYSDYSDFVLPLLWRFHDDGDGCHQDNGRLPPTGFVKGFFFRH